MAEKKSFLMPNTTKSCIKMYVGTYNTIIFFKLFWKVIYVIVKARTCVTSSA